MPVRTAILLASLALAGEARAGAIYPIDRAAVLSGSRFDLKVEFDRVVPQQDIRVTIVGTTEEGPGAPRERIRTYAEAGFPDYPAADRDGYPNRVDPRRRLAILFSDTPDHWDNGGPYLDGPAEPTVPAAERKGSAPNPAEQKRPGAVLVQGNLPASAEGGVHTVDDVVLDATGPSSERVHGFLDNTELFRVMAEALGLGQPASKSHRSARAPGARP